MHRLHKTIYGLFIILLVIVMLILLIGPKQEFSYSERRRLAKKPQISVGSIRDESYMDSLEKYLLDHFPLRDKLRGIKSLFAYNVLQQGENNGIYVVDDVAAKLEYPLSEASVVKAAEKIGKIQDMYFPDLDEKQIFYSIVPDKNFFLAKQNGFPSMDYERLVQIMNDEMSGATYIDIFSTLTIDDYYATDTHWRQERLLGTANKIATSMGFTDAGLLEGTYTMDEIKKVFDVSKIEAFYGVYYGQSALPLPSETLYYLENEATKQSKVWSLENGELLGVYTPDKGGMDQYDVFLNGAEALLKIENPIATSDNRLIVFRDSFGSSIVPLLLENYREVILIDTRYIKPELLSDYVDFEENLENTQVLFLYNTLLINSSRSSLNVPE